MTKAANLAALGSVVEVPSGSAPSFQCRAWVNFNGTGTVAIRASGNVSSVTDNTTGDYTVNFATAMPDANYAVAALNTQTARAAYNDSVDHIVGETYTASQFRIFCNNNNNGSDIAIVSLSFFR